MPGRIKYRLAPAASARGAQNAPPASSMMASLLRRQDPAAPTSVAAPADPTQTEVAPETPDPATPAPPPSPASQPVTSATGVSSVVTLSSNSITAPSSSPSSTSTTAPSSSSSATSTSTTSTSTSVPDNDSPVKGIVLNKQSIIWLVVLSVIVLVTFAIVATLLCRCKSRRNEKKSKRRTWRRTYHPSVDIRDGNARMSYYAWNRHHDPVSSTPQASGRDGYDHESGGIREKETDVAPSPNECQIANPPGTRAPVASFLEPLEPQPATPTGFLDQGGDLPQWPSPSKSPAVSFLEPLVIDHNGIPVPVRREPVDRSGTPASQSRYYSGLTKTLKRVSRIGMAM